MKRLLLLLALLTLTIAACSGDDDNDKPRPTQLLVITNEPTIEAQQMTIEALQTQVALNATATPTPLPASATPTATDTLVPAEKGVVLIDKAVVLAEPDMDAEVVGELPLSAEVSITAQTAPNRIGIVFYSIEYEDLTGWVASTQIQPVTDEPTQAAIVPTQPQRPASTSTPLPTVTSPPTATPTRTPTPLPSGFPTPEVYSVVVVEQMFERGRMIWIEPIRQIWVLTGEEVDPWGGTWECFNDTFVEGQMERDAAFDPPANITTSSSLPGAVPSQPIRGFGKIWRENPDVREALGWALTSETMHTTRWDYISSGTMEDGEFVRSPGEYRIESLYQYTLILHEDIARAPCERLSGEWEIRQ